MLPLEPAMRSKVHKRRSGKRGAGDAQAVVNKSEPETRSGCGEATWVRASRWPLNMAFPILILLEAWALKLHGQAKPGACVCPKLSLLEL